VHDPARLTRRTLSAVENAEATDGIRVSAISAWEVAMKHALGKLELTLDIDVWFQQASTYPQSGRRARFCARCDRKHETAQSVSQRSGGQDYRGHGPPVRRAGHHLRQAHPRLSTRGNYMVTA